MSPVALLRLGELRPGKLRPGELRPGELRPGELRPEPVRSREKVGTSLIGALELLFRGELYADAILYDAKSADSVPVSKSTLVARVRAFW